MRLPKCCCGTPDDTGQNGKKSSLSPKWEAIRDSLVGFVFGLGALALIIHNRWHYVILLSIFGLYFSSHSMGMLTFIAMQKKRKIIIFSVAAIGSIISAVTLILGLHYQFA